MIRLWYAKHLITNKIFLIYIYAALEIHIEPSAYFIHIIIVAKYIILIKL